MLDPAQLITSDVVTEASKLHERARSFNLTGANFLSDAIVIYGAARVLKPRIICEIGVASGLSSVLLLEGCLRGGGTPTLYAYDTMDHLYYDATKPVGFYLYESASHLSQYYKLYTGPDCYAAACVNHCNGGIGLAYIDASHMNPWAALDIIALLPAMEIGGYFLMDAVGIDAGYMQGPTYVYEYWKGPKFVGPQYTDARFGTITGFLEYDGDAEKAVDCALRAIAADWQSDVSDSYIDKLAGIVTGLVGEEYARRLRDVAAERSAQYRPYAEMHEQFSRKQLQLVQNLSIRNAQLESELAAMTNSYSWRFMKGPRYVLDAIRSLLKRP